MPYIYTDKEVTPWGGMLLIKEFYDRIGMHEQLRSLPLIEKGSGRGVDHHEIIESFIMSVILGANNCTSAAQLSYDHVLKEVFQWEHGMPSQSFCHGFFQNMTENFPTLFSVSSTNGGTMHWTTTI